MPAFEKSAELGVDYIETDVHFTKDKKFVVIHDDTIQRVTNGAGKVSGYTMDELRQFDAGHNFTEDDGKTYPYRGKGIGLLSLEEILDAFPAQKFNIDLKDKNPLQIKHFIDIIDKLNAYNRVIVASWHFINLNTLRKLRPEIATSFSVGEMIWIFFLHRSGLLFLKINFKGKALQIPERRGQVNILTKSYLKELHEKGVEVHVWTVNNEEDMRRLIEIGVDGIMSDDPALLLKVIKEYASIDQSSA
jgi:glycerophosphoryl diester phosphodiesterase